MEYPYQRQKNGCLEQEKKKSETKGFNELVQGVLTFSIREAYSDMPDEPAEGEGSGGQVTLQYLVGRATWPHLGGGVGGVVQGFRYMYVDESKANLLKRKVSGGELGTFFQVRSDRRSL